MAYKKVNPGDVTDIKDSEGVPYEGIYQGCKEISTNLGTQYIYKFKTEAGKAFGIWGFTTLNTFMECVVIGSQCRITYTGQAEEKNKYGKHLHLCTVEVDEDEGTKKNHYGETQVNEKAVEPEVEITGEDKIDFAAEFKALPKKLFSDVMRLCERKMGTVDYLDWFAQNGYESQEGLLPGQQTDIAKQLVALCKARDVVRADIPEEEIPF